MAPEYYTFTGGERVPDRVTHVLIDKALNFVPALSFYEHPNIEEVIIHDGVEKIEERAFSRCPRLRRVIMPGVKEVEKNAFSAGALSYIECGKLEIIGKCAFIHCQSLSSIDLPSAKIVERAAFQRCTNLRNAKFGKDLESIGGSAIGGSAFYYCKNLERITLPLKDGIIDDVDTFQICKKLNRVDLVGGVHETIAALLMEEWKNDMNEEIDAFNRILPNTSAGKWYDPVENDPGEKAQAIRAWITSLLRKIVHYKAEHNRILNEAAATLQPALPNDIVLKNIFPFIELPSFTFEGEH